MHSEVPATTSSAAQRTSMRPGGGAAPTPDRIRSPRGFLPAAPPETYSPTMQAAAQLQPAAVELTVLMPCLDEANTVATCVRKALAACDAAGIDAEVLVADNGSQDGSPELARAAGARVIEI